MDHNFHSASYLVTKKAVSWLRVRHRWHLAEAARQLRQDAEPYAPQQLSPKSCNLLHVPVLDNAAMERIIGRHPAGLTQQTPPFCQPVRIHFYLAIGNTVVRIGTFLAHDRAIVAQ